MSILPSVQVKLGQKSRVYFAEGSNTAKAYTRMFDVYTTGNIRFEGADPNNSVCIPYRIYGVKNNEINLAEFAEKKYVQQSVANALVGTKNGAIVAMDDVSPLEHNVAVGVRGKNLCPYPNKTVYHTGSWSADLLGDIKLPNGTYTISCDYEQLDAKSAVAISVRHYDTTVSVRESASNAVSGKLSGTFTVTDDFGGGVRIYLYSNNSVTSMTTRCSFSNIQIEKGTTATAYVPYVADGTAIAVTSCGKNIFNSRKIKYNGAANVDRQNSNEIVLSQELLQNYRSANFALPKSLVGKKVTISADVKTSGTNSALLRIMWVDTNNGATGNHVISDNLSTQTAQKLTAKGVVPTQPPDGPNGPYDTLCLMLYSNGNGTVTGGVKYTATYANIQIEVNDIATPYEPYAEGEYIITKQGDIELSSISPNMTIFTDNENVNIDATYNKDANKVIEKLTEAIISLGGNV